MSTHVTIVKKPSGHDLRIEVLNPGQASPAVHELSDNMSVEVMVYGGEEGGTITMHEIDKPQQG